MKFSRSKFVNEELIFLEMSTQLLLYAYKKLLHSFQFDMSIFYYVSVQDTLKI